MIIAVTGTPGTGKTTLAKKIAKFKGFTYLDVCELIHEKKLTEKYDEERECDVVDMEKLAKEIKTLIKEHEDLVIDSHLSHYLPQDLIDLVVVTKCDLLTLKKRLKKRGYSPHKIQENVDAEIFDICLNEAIEDKHNVIVVNTNKKVKVEGLEI